MKTKNSFNVKYIFFATVPPYDDEKKTRNRLLKYRVITPSGNTSDYLFDIFDNASSDCKIEILFKSNNNQYNLIREQLLTIVLSKNIAAKEQAFHVLVKKMYKITDERNGLGLFVLIEGKKGQETRLMLCRFKSSQALHSEGDDLKYLSQVFTKQNKHYKLAVFQDIVNKTSFWRGHAIDKQTSPNDYRPFSYFWIEEFLDAYTSITDKQGTSQFSKILKNTLNKIDNLREKEQIISAIVNLKSKTGYRTSIKSFSDKYLTSNLAKLLEEETNNDEFYNSEFGIDNDEFNKELGSTILMLEDGVTAYIPTFNYKKYVTESGTKKGQKKIVIEGLLKDKRINILKEKQKKVKNAKRPSRNS